MLNSRRIFVEAIKRYGARNGITIDLKTDHGELSVLEPEAGIAGGGEAEKRIGPVPDRKNFLSVECAHVFWFFPGL